MPILSPDMWRRVPRLADSLPERRLPDMVAERIAEWRTAGNGRKLTLELEPDVVATAAAMGAYGPALAGPPPPDVLNGARMEARFGDTADARAVERLLVHGARLPPPKAATDSPWAFQWPAAWESLLRLIEREISGPVSWIGQRILKFSGNHLAEWRKYETPACAALIRDGLVNGCDCWQWGDRFAIKSAEHAREHCERHNLLAWDGEKPLSEFIWQAAVKGALRLPRLDRGQKELAMTNDFRRGMLAKVVAHGALRAGRVLKCPQAGCWGDIGLADRCAACGKSTGGESLVAKPSWWLWKSGEREERACRRCNRCDGLFFQHAGQCPNCGKNNWSKRATHIWVARGW